jgi:betaine-aldehyde dehydrogenase
MIPGSSFVAGTWGGTSSERLLTVLDPCTGGVLLSHAAASDEDVERAAASARAAFDSGPWPRMPEGDRAALLRRVADLLVRDRDEIARRETLDTGKPLRESEVDVDDVAAAFRYYADLVVDGAVRDVDAGPGVTSRVVAEPVGVCALITPWNYPLLSVGWKVAPALAAGCCVVIKPSELTPLTTTSLVGLLAEAGAPEGTVNLVLGDGAAGAALVEHPGVDHVSFTGGTATGVKVLSAAASTVKRVQAELGGKNPNVVFADVDLDVAADNALYASMLHAGQVCSAGSRLLVEDAIHDDVVARLAEGADRIRLGSGLDARAQSGAMISEAQRAGVERAVATALDEGAELVAGGARPGDPELAGGFFYRPTVLAGCTASMRVIRDEVFGPVLTVERFASEAQAVSLANDTPYGLAGAVWTADSARGERVAAALRCGTVWINDFHPYVPGAEWGGWKQSGIGRELGPTGLAEYRETKHVWRRQSPRRSGWL